MTTQLVNKCDCLQSIIKSNGGGEHKYDTQYRVLIKSKKHPITNIVIITPSKQHQGVVINKYTSL